MSYFCSQEFSVFSRTHYNLDATSSEWLTRAPLSSAFGFCANGPSRNAVRGTRSPLLAKRLRSSHGHGHGGGGGRAGGENNKKTPSGAVERGRAIFYRPEANVRVGALCCDAVWAGGGAVCEHCTRTQRHLRIRADGEKKKTAAAGTALGPIPSIPFFFLFFLRIRARSPRRYAASSLGTGRTSRRRTFINRRVPSYRVHRRTISSSVSSPQRVLYFIFFFLWSSDQSYEFVTNQWRRSLHPSRAFDPSCTKEKKMPLLIRFRFRLFESFTFPLNVNPTRLRVLLFAFCRHNNGVTFKRKINVYFRKQ